MYIKRLYRKEFAEAFAAALEALSPRERNLLRYTTTEALDADAVAVIYGVHKATVNRWLAEVRLAVLGSVRENLRRRLRVSSAELDSILALIRSRLEVALDDAPESASRERSASA